jgi:hypothetical protein
VPEDDGEGAAAVCVGFLGIFRWLRGLLKSSEIVTRIKVLKDTNMASWKPQSLPRQPLRILPGPSPSVTPSYPFPRYPSPLSLHHQTEPPHQRYSSTHLCDHRIQWQRTTEIEAEYLGMGLVPYKEEVEPLGDWKNVFVSLALEESVSGDGGR